MTDNKGKRTVCFFVGLVVVACLEMGTLPVIVMFWRHDRDQLLAPKQQTQCYRWNKFASAEGEENCPLGLKTTIVKNTTVCCGSSSTVLDKLITKILSDKYNNDANPEMARLNLTEYNCDVAKAKLPVAKLVGIAQNKKPVLVGTSSKVFWNSGFPSHLTSGLVYLPDDSTIYVKSAGYYFVTSQMKLRLVTTNNTDDETEDMFRHYVHLISNDDTGSTLLENAKQRCDVASTVAEFTSNVGAVFKFDVGDRLYVATSHPRLLVTDDRDSYFSMHNI